MQRLPVRPSVAAQERLEALIDREGLQPGDRLPTERELAARWGASRAAVRAAIRRLVDAGAIHNVQGSGTYVSVPRVTRDLRDLRSFAEAAAGRAFATRVLGWAVFPAAPDVADRLDLPAGAPVHRLRRLRLLDGTPAAIEESVLSRERFPDLPARYDPEGGSLYRTLRTGWNVEVVGGYEQLSVAPLDADAAALLECGPETSVFALAGVAHDGEDRPVETFTSLVRADLVRFASELGAVGSGGAGRDG